MILAYVVLSLDVGGLERVVLDLAREGRALGQGVSIACVERPGALADEAREMGVAVACAGKRPGLRPATVARLRSILRELRPDVVHTHQVGALAYAGPAARLAGGIPVLHTEHGKHYGSRARTRLLGRLAAGFASRFACVSADIAGEVVRRGVERAHDLRPWAPAVLRAQLFWLRRSPRRYLGSWLGAIRGTFRSPRLQYPDDVARWSAFFSFRLPAMEIFCCYSCC